MAQPKASAAWSKTNKRFEIWMEPLSLNAASAAYKGETVGFQLSY
jgi:hypothetical protein